MGTKAFTGDISGGRLSFMKRSDMYGENKKIGTRKCGIRLCGIDRSHQLSAFPRAGHGSCRQKFYYRTVCRTDTERVFGFKFFRAAFHDAESRRGPGTVHFGGFRTGGIYGIYVIRLCDC